MFRSLFLLTPALVLCTAGISPAGIRYAYSFFDVGGSTSIAPAAINDGGVIVGAFTYARPDGTAGTMGFERHLDGSIIEIRPPGSNDDFDTANGINNFGVIVGNFLHATPGTAESAGFFDHDGTFISYRVSGQPTAICGINDLGDFVGTYNTGTGFVNVSGNISTIAAPPTVVTFPRGINSGRQIVGWYESPDGGISGFIADGTGAFGGPIRFPGSVQTFPAAIDNNGDIAGSYTDSSGIFHGFVISYSAGYVRVDVPGAISTMVGGVNDEGTIVGNIQTEAGKNYAFIGVPY